LVAAFEIIPTVPGEITAQLSIVGMTDVAPITLKLQVLPNSRPPFVPHGSRGKGFH